MAFPIEYPVMVNLDELRNMIATAERDDMESVAIGPARPHGHPFMTFTEGRQGVFTGLSYGAGGGITDA